MCDEVKDDEVIVDEVSMTKNSDATSLVHENVENSDDEDRTKQYLKELP